MLKNGALLEAEAWVSSIFADPNPHVDRYSEEFVVLASVGKDPLSARAYRWMRD